MHQPCLSMAILRMLGLLSLHTQLKDSTALVELGKLLNSASLIFVKHGTNISRNDNRQFRLCTCGDESESVVHVLWEFLCMVILGKQIESGFGTEL